MRHGAHRLIVDSLSPKGVAARPRYLWLTPSCLSEFISQLPTKSWLSSGVPNSSAGFRRLGPTDSKDLQHKGKCHSLGRAEQQACSLPSNPTAKGSCCRVGETAGQPCFSQPLCKTIPETATRDTMEVHSTQLPGQGGWTTRRPAPLYSLACVQMPFSNLTAQDQRHKQTPPPPIANFLLVLFRRFLLGPASWEHSGGWGGPERHTCFGEDRQRSACVWRFQPAALFQALGRSASRVICRPLHSQVFEKNSSPCFSLDFLSYPPPGPGEKMSALSWPRWNF